MKRFLEIMFLFFVGGSVYYTFEIMFRGYSHWTMFVLGGICLCFFWIQGMAVQWKDPLWRQLIRCMIFVTSMEFTTGIIVNKWLKIAVWDYSALPFNLFGQICVQFMIIFSGLAMVGIFLSGYFMHWIFNEEKPDYTVF